MNASENRSLSGSPERVRFVGLHSAERSNSRTRIGPSTLPAVDGSSYSGDAGIIRAKCGWQSPVRPGPDRNLSIPSKGAARGKGAPHRNLVPAEGLTSLHNLLGPAVHVTDHRGSREKIMSLGQLAIREKERGIPGNRSVQKFYAVANVLTKLRVIESWVDQSYPHEHKGRRRERLWSAAFRWLPFHWDESLAWSCSAMVWAISL
jgi:hypothetical protein